MTIPTKNNDKPPLYTKLPHVDFEGRLPSNQTTNNNDNNFPSNQRLSNGEDGKRRHMFVILVVLLLLSIIALTTFFILSFKLKLRIKHESWPFLGHHSTNKKLPPMKMSEEHDAKLIAKYKLQNSNEETTVYRNFRTGYETMKSRGILRSVCYIRKMEINDMRNSTAITKSLSQQYKSHFYNVIAPPKEAHEGVDWLMGRNAHSDCSQSEVMWIEPMQYQEYIAPVGQNNNNNTSLYHYDDNNNHKREKRSIRSCRQTCCWRVCCCDVHHFQWQVAEEFNCNHVCDKCSHKYRSVIQRLC